MYVCVYVHSTGVSPSLCVKFSVKRKNVVESLLDNTRSRNIEIFLPSFPLTVQSLDADLDQQLNIIDRSTKLNIEHIVALKRYVNGCVLHKIITTMCSICRHAYLNLGIAADKHVYVCVHCTI